MAHQAQLANVKYRNWVKAGLGIKYVKEGLEPFCDGLAKQQHCDLINNIKLKQSLTTVSCGYCNERTLQPNHVKIGKNLCPLFQTNCNCQYPGGKVLCPNNVCGAIYDEIIQLHDSIPPAPYWKNTDARQWCTEPWSVAKCFINASGYEQKTKASEFDCSGLLHVLINNKGFHQHIKCRISGTDVFSKVRMSRNKIFHSHTMELEDSEVNSCIDDMIEVLEDDKEIKHMQDSKDAVKKLLELKQKDFIILTTDETEIRRVAMAAINEKEKELEQTITDADNKLKTTADEEKHDIEGIGSCIKSELQQTGQRISEDLEIHKNLIERSMSNNAETKNDDVASKERKDFQKKLIKLYERDVTKVTQLPRLHQNKRDVDDMYVTSWMTEDSKNEKSGEWEEVNISMDKIFGNKEKPAKSIFVIGEAGSGKSTFCKMLVHFWCMAHSEQEGSSNKPDIVHEIKRFDFLFFVSLRYHSDCDCIEKMLEKSFKKPALGDILQNDSSKCLMVLDGLDEWNLDKKHISQFQTSGLPGRELDADYTIITTSRQWKFDVLSLSDSEVGKIIKLNGINQYEIETLTVKTVETLNGIHKKNKNAKECINDLGSRQVSDISHTPLMLQQLVCLWFNDKLGGNSKCAIYGSMLDLFLEWKSLETSEIQDQLYGIQTPRRNKEVKQYLSHLANETLFDQNKETTLAFSSSKLDQILLPHDDNDVIKASIASGILKEERNVSMSETMESTFSFFHKSAQEYLAAMYIASQFEERLSSKDEHALTDLGKKCVDKYFGSCKTGVEILEQSNICIMLCGLEPRLMTNVSEHIYNISLVDEIVVKERNKVPGRYSLNISSKMIIGIQTCIFNCIEEFVTSLPSSQLENDHTPVYIADLYISHSIDLLHVPDCHNIILKNVLSVEIVDNPNRMRARDKEDNKAFQLAVEHSAKSDQLKIIRFEANNNTSERIYKKVNTILATNANTLETVSLFNINERMVSQLVSTLPKMRQLSSLHVNVCVGGSVPKNVMLSLGKFLKQATRLQHISLNDLCENFDTLKLDLSKHKQLQHVDFMRGSFCMVSCSTDNLETCKLCITSSDRMDQVRCMLCKAWKLKQLSLYGGRDFQNNEKECRNITENLIRLLPSLVSLSPLELFHFNFTDNIIASPCDMKKLKEITLGGVTMTMTTWCKFIDSLFALPQVVAVKLYDMNITDNIFVSRMRDEKQLADAVDYVREKTKIFRVTCYKTYDLDFITKKV